MKLKSMDIGIAIVCIGFLILQAAFAGILTIIGMKAGGGYVSSIILLAVIQYLMIKSYLKHRHKYT